MRSGVACPTQPASVQHCGELCALLPSMQVRAQHVVPDYIGVVNAVVHPQAALGRKRPYAGICKQAFAAHTLPQVRHVRSHQAKPAWNENCELCRDIEGNEQADVWAKVGAHMGAGVAQQLVHEAEQELEDHKHYLIHVATRLERWADGERAAQVWLGQAPAHKIPEAARCPTGHVWYPHSGVFRCLRCLTKTAQTATRTAHFGFYPDAKQPRRAASLPPSHRRRRDVRSRPQ